MFECQRTKYQHTAKYHIVSSTTWHCTKYHIVSKYNMALSKKNATIHNPTLTQETMRSHIVSMARACDTTTVSQRKRCASHPNGARTNRRLSTPVRQKDAELANDARGRARRPTTLCGTMCGTGALETEPGDFGNGGWAHGSAMGAGPGNRAR